MAAKLVRSKRPDKFEKQTGAKAPSNYRANKVVEATDVVLPPTAVRPTGEFIQEQVSVPQVELLPTLPASYQKSNVKPVVEEKKTEKFVYTIPESYTGRVPTFEEVKSDFVSELEVRLDDTGARSWKEIDSIMRGICKKHNISPTKLHKDFKKKHGMIPDEWVKRNDPKENIKEDLRSPMEKLADQIAATSPKEIAVTEATDPEIRIAYLEKTIQDMRKMMLEMTQGTIVHGLGMGSSGGGEVRVNRMDDVAIPQLEDGDVLVWDSEMEKWIPGRAAGSGFGNLTDKIVSLEDKIFKIVQYIEQHGHEELVGLLEVEQDDSLIEVEQSGSGSPVYVETEGSGSEGVSLPDLDNFWDSTPDGDTTRFVVDVDHRGVYTLDGIAQPTVTLPRGDILEFDVNALDNPEHFDLYKNGELLASGRARFEDTGIVRLHTGQVATDISKVYYKNSQVSGMGWVISITDN